MEFSEALEQVKQLLDLQESIKKLDRTGIKYLIETIENVANNLPFKEGDRIRLKVPLATTDGPGNWKHYSECLSKGATGRIDSIQIDGETFFYHIKLDKEWSNGYEIREDDQKHVWPVNVDSLESAEENDEVMRLHENKALEDSIDYLEGVNHNIKKDNGRESLVIKKTIDSLKKSIKEL